MKAKYLSLDLRCIQHGRVLLSVAKIDIAYSSLNDLAHASTQNLNLIIEINFFVPC